VKGYEIKFKDGTSILTDDVNGKKIFELWMERQSQLPFSINDNGYLVGDIKRIEQYSSPEMPVEVPIEKRIDYNRCRGFRSIQAAIHQRIIKDYGVEWLQAVRDQSVREEIRAELRADKTGWCDAKAGECVCPSGYISTRRKDLN
jgi:hypothetical protein